MASLPLPPFFVVSAAAFATASPSLVVLFCGAGAVFFAAGLAAAFLATVFAAGFLLLCFVCAVAGTKYKAIIKVSSAYIYLNFIARLIFILCYPVSFPLVSCRPVFYRPVSSVLCHRPCRRSSGRASVWR